MATRRASLTLSVALRACAIVASVIASVIVARLGGPDVKGVAASFAASATTLSVVFSLGVPEQVVEYSSKNLFRSPRRLLVSIWIVYSVVGAALIALLLPFETSLAVVVGGCLIYMVPAQAAIAALGFSGVLPQAVGALLQPLSLAAASGVLAIDSGLTATEAVAATAFSYLCPLYLYWRRIPGDAAAQLTWATVFSVFFQGARWQPPAVALRLVQRADIVAVFLLMSPAKAGIYSVAMQLSELCFVVPRQIAGHSYHLLVTRKAISVKKSLLNAGIAGLLVAAIIAILGGWGIELLYGDAFVESQQILFVMLPGTVAGGLALIMTFVFRAEGLLRESLIASSAAALTSVGGSLVMIPILGVMGAALACSLAWLVFAFVSVLLWRWNGSQRPSEQASAMQGSDDAPTGSSQDMKG